MRQRSGAIRRARAGDTVRIRCKIRSGEPQARLYVWTSIGDFEFSPHVPLRALDVTEDGLPRMVRPLSVSLDHEHRKTHTFEFLADMDMRVCVMEERDFEGRPAAKIRIYTHGPAYENFVRGLRNLIRRVGYRPSQAYRHQ